MRAGRSSGEEDGIKAEKLNGCLSYNTSVTSTERGPPTVLKIYSTGWRLAIARQDHCQRSQTEHAGQAPSAI